MTKLWMLAPFAAITLAAPAMADPVFDQTAPNYSNRYVSQDFEAQFDAYDSAVIDDLTLAGPTRVTSVTAALVGFTPDFTSFSNVGSYHINIYSSAAAAGGNLTGDVFSTTFSPAFATNLGTFTIDGRTDQTETLRFDLSGFGLVLNPGTYYLGVSGSLDSSMGEIGTAVTGNGGDAYIAVPGNGFGQGTLIGLGGRSAGYRVDGTAFTPAVPELGTWAMMIAGMGAVGYAMRRRKVATGVRFA